MKNILTFVVVFWFHCAFSQIEKKTWKQITQWEEGPWFATDEAKKIADNVLLYQRNTGGWPKNIQMQRYVSSDEIENRNKQKTKVDDTTIDNGATCQEMLFLSKIYRQTKEERYKKGFLLGLEYLLNAQYENGGWPQYYPLIKGYYTHITFNDDAMVNVLSLLKELKEKTGFYSVELDPETYKKTEIAFNKGIQCILKTQYYQNGILTAWCAQHDENTLLPTNARSYELASLSGKESAGIVGLLLSIKNPSDEVQQAINAAIKWFEKTKITNLKEERTLDANGKVIAKKMVITENTSPVWARFMELETNEPFFCDRDGIKKKTMEEIGSERRNGYAWYTNEPEEVLKKYGVWSKNNAQGNKKKKGSKQSIDDYHFIVDVNGSGDFTKIQDAVNAARSYPDQRINIFVKNGIYHEKVKIHAWNTKISLIGENKEKTKITFDDHFKKINVGRNSTFHTYTVLVEGTDCSIQNLTIENSSGELGQAVALYVNANRTAVINCNLLGNQDTLYASGEGAKNYFKDCYIEGTTDFIFGDATAYFESCILHSKNNSYITAASTPENAEFGYVFKNCRLTANDFTNEVYLGRPWRPHAKTVFINCEMGKHILPQGWHNWSKPEVEKTTFYAEYKCYGQGFQPDKRVRWSHQLSKKEAKKYILENILNDSGKTWYKNPN